MKRFENKVVIITGASSGLGKDAAIRLAKEGANLTLVGRNCERLKETRKEINDLNLGNETLIVIADVANEDDVKKYVDKTVEKWGKIDGFLNNSGMEGKQNLTEDYGSDEFRRVVDVNLNGVFYGLKYVLKVMKKQNYGHIVNTASVGGIRGVGNQSGYSASKHGVVGLTRNSAIEYGQFGITVNAIAPGAIMTKMVEDSLRQMDPENPEKAGEAFVSVNPMKRFGKPEEVSGVIAFLLSDDANFVNGVVLPIDGGQSYKY
mgnify:CR=1 FL=1